MTLQPPPPARAAVNQAGMSLISVLVAIVIFGLGMLSIASLYSLAVPAQTANQEALDTAAFGNQFWAILQASPQVVSQLSAGVTQSYTSASASAPAALQPWLANIFSTPSMMLPGAKVTITTGAGADGNPCDVSNPNAPLCGVTLTIAWAAGKGGGGARSQTYQYQVGF
ncbi:putative Tfp pilus assembly protein PilV [Thiomonas arsenitoxydans]|uniref:Tfp pilus assembly protein PilV n=1 Tax=Thiomonas arsenitoxydans (strain DSM 22701 / CIP 110005 / 3As) TaxID=426114 RepID=D6CKR7_THIA3|nr:prepilin-type N-terminal cleavage/methylation domain-containing protein [Thiomonas arsenitoxydans]CAZ87535.1 putative Tfp pilus assembly protein PilV [Thiomonas arsenitoxydans]CQR27117.1 putative Tfp pilus assembly protein PilV [Thiomonas arsenitoxydans]CQR29828.1 putative Tfp pilus assembly protein PilV [Thiomonas arsenitoxydans]CQR29839.1 putative Tfp pilus assembly protein PilV [Thiomonas arsenitoxydans]CQR32683.1 putative Tfp pilus assembly protein PilV [Thiomonas arsenitoxydans]